MRLCFHWTDEQVKTLLNRAKKAGYTGRDDREIIYHYLCGRENLVPVKRGGRREEAIQGTKRYHQAKSA